MAWQDISSAGKDGQYVLLWTPRGSRGHPSIGYWGRDNPYNPVGWVSFSTTSTPINHIDQPSAWQPLPAPPTSAGEG